jgi:hypothetical protein
MPLAGAPRVGALSYQPRAMEGTVLHRVVREHFEAFRAVTATRTDGGGLPQLVEREHPRPGHLYLGQKRTSTLC